MEKKSIKHGRLKIVRDNLNTVSVSTQMVIC